MSAILPHSARLSKRIKPRGGEDGPLFHYLVSKLDARQMARLAGKKGGGEKAREDADGREKAEKKWLSVWNEALWERIV